MFVKIAATILAGYTLVFGLFCIVAMQSGVAVVNVVNHREGNRIFLPVPLVLGNIGLRLVPDEALADIQRELGPHRGVVEAAIEELRSCPDGPFLEVENGDESVLIEKKGDNIVVKVESDEQDVYVRVPLRGTRKLIEQLARS